MEMMKLYQRQSMRPGHKLITWHHQSSKKNDKGINGNNKYRAYRVLDYIVSRNIHHLQSTRAERLSIAWNRH